MASLAVQTMGNLPVAKEQLEQLLSGQISKFLISN